MQKSKLMGNVRRPEHVASRVAAAALAAPLLLSAVCANAKPAANDCFNANKIAANSNTFLPIPDCSSAPLTFLDRTGPRIVVSTSDRNQANKEKIYLENTLGAVGLTFVVSAFSVLALGRRKRFGLKGSQPVVG